METTWFCTYTHLSPCEPCRAKMQSLLLSWSLCEVHTLIWEGTHCIAHKQLLSVCVHPAGPECRVCCSARSCVRSTLSYERAHIVLRINNCPLSVYTLQGRNAESIWEGTHRIAHKQLFTVCVHPAGPECRVCCSARPCVRSTLSYERAHIALHINNRPLSA